MALAWRCQCGAVGACTPPALRVLWAALASVAALTGGAHVMMYSACLFLALAELKSGGGCVCCSVELTQVCLQRTGLSLLSRTQGVWCSALRTCRRATDSEAWLMSHLLYWPTGPGDLDSDISPAPLY